MSTSILVAYATRYGSSLGVLKRNIASLIETMGSIILFIEGGLKWKRRRHPG
jgi:hypothetical protein